MALFPPLQGRLAIEQHQNMGDVSMSHKATVNIDPAVLLHSSSSSCGCALPVPTAPLPSPLPSHGRGMEWVPCAGKQPSQSLFFLFAAQDCMHSNSIILGFTTLTSHLPHIRRMCLSFVFSCAQAQRNGQKVQGGGCFRKALGRAVCTHRSVQI